jgi:hypothetical protein
MVTRLEEVPITISHFSENRKKIPETAHKITRRKTKISVVELPATFMILDAISSIRLEWLLVFDIKIIFGFAIVLIIQC